MKIIERLKNAGFWVSIAAAVVLVLQAFGIKIAEAEISAAVNAVCSALVMLGILNNPTEGRGYFDLSALVGGEDVATDVDETVAEAKSLNGDSAETQTGDNSAKN